MSELCAAGSGATRGKTKPILITLVHSMLWHPENDGLQLCRGFLWQNKEFELKTIATPAVFNSEVTFN